MKAYETATVTSRGSGVPEGGWGHVMCWHKYWLDVSTRMHLGVLVS